MQKQQSNKRQTNKHTCEYSEQNKGPKRGLPKNKKRSDFQNEGTNDSEQNDLTSKKTIKKLLSNKKINWSTSKKGRKKIKTNIFQNKFFISPFYFLWVNALLFLSMCRKSGSILNSICQHNLLFTWPDKSQLCPDIY